MTCAQSNPCRPRFTDLAPWLLAASLLVGLSAPGPARAQPTGSVLSQQALDEGIAYRRQGQLHLAAGSLQRACSAAPDDAARLRATAELGATLLQARRLDEAAQALHQAHAFFEGVDRARVAIDLGNLAVLQGRPAIAQGHYQQALQLGGAERSVRLAATLNLARLAAPGERPALLDPVAEDLASLPEGEDKLRWRLNLGQQLAGLGPTALAQAHAQLDAVRLGAMALDRPVLLAEALDALAQLYEDQKRPTDALALSRQGLAVTSRLPEGAAGLSALNLGWRAARLAEGGPGLASYLRLVEQIERLRQDIPISNELGVSTLRSTLEPIYLQLVQQLLLASDSASADERPALLRRVVDTVELLRQAELQDYLGDRCEVDALKGGGATTLPPGTALLYPVILPDRLELLLETPSGLSRHAVNVDATRLRLAAASFAGSLRSGKRGLIDEARQLYDWVLRPVQAALEDQGIRTLVVVPDGALRLVAIGAFHDGERYAIEKYALATVTGLSMTSTAAASGGRRGLLMAGVTTPGPVIDRLGRDDLVRLLGPQAASRFEAPTLVASRGLRSLRGAASAAGADKDPSAMRLALREALSLPGVGKELAAIAEVIPGKRLLNEEFTVDAFRREAESGRYGIVHVASHGVFGGSADSSYLLAYDELLTLDGLQKMLRADSLRRRPIELLSLSACETAEGDERSPLGMSGAAIRARAQSVVGSLWPVSDEAAVLLMTEFYRGLLAQGLSKAEALQQAQIGMLRSQQFSHPFFWAPFIVIGNWS